MAFGLEGLAVAMVGAFPSRARISLTNKDVFEPVLKAIGPPAGGLARKEHGVDVFQAEVFNLSMAWSIDQLIDWHERHGWHMSERLVERELFSKYLETGEYVAVQSLVVHPDVPRPERFSACSVAFQQGDIYYANGRENLFLWSQLHSSSSPNEFVNLAPTAVKRISFPTDTIWYPFEVTKLNKEPTAVVLNLMTTKPLDTAQLPDAFKVEKRGRLPLGVETYWVTRVTATFEGGQEVQDLRLKL